MTLSRADLFNKNISSKKLNTNLNLQFERGWSPVLKPVYDGSRVVLQVINWVGGEGVPPVNTILYYLGADSFVIDIEDAIDIASGYMSSTVLTQLIDGDTVDLVLSNDGYLYLSYDNFPNTLTGTPISTTTINTFMFSNDPTLSGKSDTHGATQGAIWQAIENAKTKFNIPIITLDSAKVSAIEAMTGLTSDNPYFAMVGVDDRKTGTVGGCPGWEGMCSPIELDGSTCSAQVNWQEAEWLVTVTNAGNPGEVLQIVLDGQIAGQYTVQIGDTTDNIARALTTYIINHHGTHDFDADWNNDNTLTVIAPAESGTTANSWSEAIVSTGDVAATISQTQNGIDFRARTCTGVEGHFIGYDGTTWYDFGVSFSNVFTTNIYTGSKYYIQSGETVDVPDYSQYIVHNEFINDGILNLGLGSQLIVL